MKNFQSDDYNYVFDETNGLFMRWGKTIDDNPEWCKYGPEILDLELSTVCSGIKGKVCPFCYKSNTPKGSNMSFEVFKKILDNILKTNTLTQVAFGVGDIDANPDLFEIMSYCRSKNIVPNLTINGDRLTDDIVNNLMKYIGAIAISNYDKDICYNAVKKFSNAGLKQVNIHQFTSEETYDKILELLSDCGRDERLNGLNAIVFLSLKKKGRGKDFSTLSVEKFKNIIETAFFRNISIGFDSCSYNKFKQALSPEKAKKVEFLCEPCESALFSSYVNVEGKFFPCSFMEGEEEWKDGIDVVNCNDFLKDVWMNIRVVEWRNKLIKNNRNCPCFQI